MFSQMEEEHRPFMGLLQGYTIDGTSRLISNPH